MSEFGDNVYIVDKILEKRTRKGKTEVLVKWKGFGNKHNTWEPKDNILCPKLLAQFDLDDPPDNVHSRKQESTSNQTVDETASRAKKRRSTSSVSSTVPPKARRNYNSGSGSLMDDKQLCPVTQDHGEGEKGATRRDVSPPVLLPMVSESKLQEIRNRELPNTRPGSKDSFHSSVIVTEIDVEDKRVVFRESYRQEGFFHSFNAG